MSTVNVVNWKKEKVSSIDLAPSVFDVEVKNEVLHEVVKWQLASRRQGTAMTKTRGLVSGGGIKPFKQKGTGNARQGSTRSPLMPGGAKLFGPVPRSYAYALPKQVRRLGLKMALSLLNKEGRLYVVDSLASSGKTADLAKKLKDFGVQKAVLVDAKIQDQTKRASGNLAKFRYLSSEGLNVYDLLKYDTAIISQEAIAAIVARCEAE
jgi:large subunit ribosomal protein L4